MKPQLLNGAPVAWGRARRGHPAMAARIRKRIERRILLSCYSQSEDKVRQCPCKLLNREAAIATPLYLLEEQ
jgi:hypothetical protein